MSYATNALTAVSLTCVPSNTWTMSVSVVRTPVSWPVLGTTAVTSTPTGINCGTDCSEPYPGGTVVTLTAGASPGWVLSGWTGPCTPSGNNCTATMDAAKSVTATFMCPRFSLCDGT